jgi:hypothetical protein
MTLLLCKNRSFNFQRPMLFSEAGMGGNGPKHTLVYCRSA